ncbi:MAG TPA: hypothetical protein VIP77_14255 [Jiangellaceae bacterium]
MPLPYTSPVDVFLILTRGDDVLLALRKDTGYADGLWNLPSGKLEAGEPVTSSMCRAAIAWFPANRLPAPTVPYTRAGHRLWRSGADVQDRWLVRRPSRPRETVRSGQQLGRRSAR